MILTILIVILIMLLFALYMLIDLNLNILQCHKTILDKNLADAKKEYNTSKQVSHGV